MKKTTTYSSHLLDNNKAFEEIEDLETEIFNTVCNRLAAEVKLPASKLVPVVEKMFRERGWFNRMFDEMHQINLEKARQ